MQSGPDIQQEDSMMVICCGEQLRQALHLLQEGTEWCIAGQSARVNTGLLEEEEVACCLHQVGEILVPPERRVPTPWLTRPAEPRNGSSAEDSS